MKLRTNSEQLELFEDSQAFAFEAKEFCNFDDPSLSACSAQQLKIIQPQPQLPQLELVRPQESRFGAPKTEEQIELARRESVPKKIRQDTAYYVCSVVECMDQAQMRDK